MEPAPAQQRSMIGVILRALCSSLVLRKDYRDYYWGLYRGYYRDPFPHALVSAREVIM